MNNPRRLLDHDGNNVDIRSYLALAGKWAAGIVVGITAIWMLVIIIRFESLRWVYHTIALWLNSSLNIDSQFVPFAAMALTALAVPLIPYVTSFFLLGKRSKEMMIMVIVISGALFVLLWCFGGEVIFGPDGEVRRCWALTPDGVKVVAKSSGEDCPWDKTFHIRYQPMTAEIAPSVLAAQRGETPVKLTPSEARQRGFFDPGNGKVQVYYTINGSDYQLYSGPGFSPLTQEPLLPVTRSVVDRIQNFINQEIEKEEATRRQSDLQREAQEAAERQRFAEELEKSRKLAREQEQLSERRDDTQEKSDVYRHPENPNDPDLIEAVQQYKRGNLLAARDRLHSVLLRNPGNVTANAYSRNWNIAVVCPDCGTVKQIWEAKAVTDLLGYMTGNRNALKFTYQAEICMDNGSLETIKFQQRPTFRQGQRVVVKYAPEGIWVQPQR